MNTKLKKILIINAIILFLCIFILEFITYRRLLAEENYNKYDIERNGFIRNCSYLPILNFEKAVKAAENNTPKSNRIEFRNIDYEKSPPLFDINKKSILLLGCSFAYGTGVEEDKTFQYLLEKFTKRKVFNRSLQGYGIQHALYILQNSLNLIQKNQNYIPPKYVIYTFIEDHIFRLMKSNDFFDIYLMFYKYNKDKTKLVQCNDLDILYWHSYFLRNLHRKKSDSSISYKNGEIEINSEFSNYMKQHFTLMNDEIKKNFPEAEFIIFVYNGDKHIKNIQQELKNQQIKIVYLSELSNINFKDKEYVLEDNQHPNAKAWQTITPLFIKKLGL